VRDSAGVRIVESPEPLWTAESAWRIDPDLVVQVGVIDGAEPYQFTGISDAVVFPDGGFAVSDRSSEVRVFNPDGTHAVTLGRRGQGPGEFLVAPRLAIAPPDTLIAWDARQLRLSWFDRGGALLKDRRIEAHPAIVHSSMTYLPGTWHVAADASIVHSRQQGPNAPAAAPYTVYLIASDSVGSTVLPLEVREVRPVARTEPRARDRATIGLLSPFGSSLSVAVRGDPTTVYTGDGNLWEVRAYGGDGRLTDIFRPQVPRLPVTPELIAQGRDSAEANWAAQDRALIREAYEKLEHPDSTAAVGSLLWDDSGYLWVGRAPLFTTSQPPLEFEVLNSEGHWLGRVSLPPEAGYVLRIGYQRVLTVWIDDLGVHYVRIYRVRTSTK
jgi:hypothetical protein